MVAMASDGAAAAARTPLDDLADCEAALVRADESLGWRLRVARDPFVATELAAVREGLGLLRAATTALLVGAAGYAVVAVACDRCGRHAPLGAMAGLPGDAGFRCRDRVACKAERRQGGAGQ